MSLEVVLRETLASFAEKETEETWNKFNTTLKRWAEIYSASVNETDAALLDAATKLQEPLKQSALSLRSSLSASACGLIAAMATRLGPYFASQIGFYGSALIELCGRSNKLFNRYAEQAMLTVLQHTKADVLAPQFVNCLRTSRSNVQRSFCVKFILTMLETQAPFEEETLDFLAEGIQLGLNDGDANARAQAREAFRSLQAVNSQRAQRVFNSLDEKKQASLNAVIDKATAVAPAVPATPLSSKQSTAKFSAILAEIVPSQPSVAPGPAATPAKIAHMGLPARPKFDAQRVAPASTVTEFATPSTPAHPQRIIPATPLHASSLNTAPVTPAVVPQTPTQQSSKGPKRTQLGAAVRAVRAPSQAVDATATRAPRRINPAFLNANRDTLISFVGKDEDAVRNASPSESEPPHEHQVTSSAEESSIEVAAAPAEITQAASTEIVAAEQLAHQVENIVPQPTETVHEATEIVSQATEIDTTLTQVEQVETKPTEIVAQPVEEVVLAQQAEEVVAQQVEVPSTTKVATVTSLSTASLINERVQQVASTLMTGRLSERKQALDTLLSLYAEHGSLLVDQLRGQVSDHPPAQRLPFLKLLDQMQQNQSILAV